MTDAPVAPFPLHDPKPHIARTRRALTRALGALPERVPLNVEVLDSVDCGTYRRDHIVYDSERFMSVPAYLLVPHDRRGPGPAILAQHGHGPGKDEVVGLAEVGDEGSVPNDYGHQLALRGYVVLAPDLRTFGERADWEPPNMYSCDHTYMYAALLGHQLLALDLWDLARGLDVLCADPLVDAKRLGMVGLSQGGTCTLFLAAWDLRIRAAVVSGYLNRWDVCATIGWNMCGSQVLPGIARQVSHLDLGALVAPRALLVETGTEDNIFPVDAARSTMAALAEVYAALEVGDRVEHDVFEGGHKWHGDVAYPFLEKWL
ncbi:MAG: alpha/beta hydrolase family protein [Acidimicrobiales bacterium]